MATTSAEVGARGWPAGPEDAAKSASSSMSEHGIGELVARLSEQTSRLVRDELRLAELETRQRAKVTGLGVGMLGLAAGAAVLAAGALVAAAVWAVHLDLPGWLACVVVAAGLLGFAGMAALVGRAGIRKAGGPVPRAAMKSTRADVDAVREALRS